MAHILKKLVLCVVVYSCSSQKVNNKQYSHAELRKMTLNDVTKVIKGNISKVKSCYYKEIRRKGLRPSGSITLVLLIRPNGEVKRAGVEVEDNETVPISLQSCVIEVLFALRFPAPRTGKPFKINQPLKF